MGNTSRRNRSNLKRRFGQARARCVTWHSCSHFRYADIRIHIGGRDDNVLQNIRHEAFINKGELARPEFGSKLPHDFGAQ